MKKLLLISFSAFCITSVQAQQTSGKVTYVRTMHLQMHIDNGEGERTMPQTQTDKFELSFADGQSIWKHAEEQMQPDDMSDGGGGIRIRMAGPGGGTDDISYCNFDLAKKVDQRELFGKKYIVTDSIKKLNWKLTGETETILGHLCQKAIAQNPVKRMMMSVENGQMQRKEINDTATLVAWFTTDIPVPAGPEVAGQLPGLILALDTDNGRSSYKAVEITDKLKPEDIKEPVKGKKVTPAEFRKESDKLMKEMMESHPGGRNTIRIGG